MKTRFFPLFHPGLLVGLAACLAACTDSDTTGDDTRVDASIGNACGPADGREVWIRVAEKETSDTNAVDACPAFTDGGLRIVLLNDGRGLDALEPGPFAMRWAWDCRAGDCQARRAAVTVTKVGDTTVLGSYTLFDTLGVQLAPKTHFKAARCVLTPHCG